MEDTKRKEMLERKRVFVECLRILLEQVPEAEVKEMAYRVDLDGGEEWVDIKFKGGLIKKARVGGDNHLAMMYDIMRAIWRHAV